MKLPIQDIKTNPNNPRFIKDSNFKSLVKSIKNLPVMTDLREVIIDENNMIIGGNMRYKAMEAAKWKEIPVKMFTREMAELNNELAKKDNPDFVEKTYEEYVEEIIIKDNVSGGDWDWDILANEWNASQLEEWGLVIPNEDENKDKNNDIELENKKVIEISFETDEELEKVFNELVERGLSCRILTL